MNERVYEFTAVIRKVPDVDGAYVEFFYDARAEFGAGRVAVRAAFDGAAYDGWICHIIGLRRDIRARIGKRPGGAVRVTIVERARSRGRQTN